MKKIITIIIITACVLTFAACNSDTDYTEEEVFAGRANWTINRNMNKLHEQKVIDYALDSVEYYETGGAKVVRAAFLLRADGDEYFRCVFMVSDKESYLEDFLERNNYEFKIVSDTTTGLSAVSLDNYNFSTDKDNQINKDSVREILQKFHDTGDESIFE